MKTTVQVEVTLDLTVEAFCEMNCDEQARFFNEVAEKAGREWTGTDRQWFFIGRALVRNRPSGGLAMLRAITEAAKDET